MLTTISVIFVFSFIVVIHELGHFLVCRWLGVRVESFSVGFGKEIVGFNWVGTRWSFRLLPLGGFVKPAGDDIENNSGAPDEFFGQAWYRRIAIALAGPVMNYILAFLCFFWMMFYWGEPKHLNDPVIGEVISGYPAQIAGFKAGDKITTINGVDIKTWEDLAGIIHKNPEKPIDIKYIRKTDEGQIEKISALVPKKDPREGHGLIGISPTLELVPMGAVKSVIYAKTMTIYLSKMILTTLGGAVKTAVVDRKKPELEMTGPLGIVKLIAEATHKGLRDVIWLIAVISLSLGLFNLFPIPVLDGGHVFLYILEGINRKPLKLKTINTANSIGFVLIISLFLFITYKDIVRLVPTFW